MVFHYILNIVKTYTTTAREPSIHVTEFTIWNNISLGLGCANSHINKWCQLCGLYLSFIENLFKLQIFSILYLYKIIFIDLRLNFIKSKSAVNASYVESRVDDVSITTQSEQNCKWKWNVTTLIWLGGGLLVFVEFYCSLLGLNFPTCPPEEWWRQ